MTLFEKKKRFLLRKTKLKSKNHTYLLLKNIIIFRIVLLHLNNHINLVLKFMEDFKRRQEILVDAISREYLLPYSYNIL